MLTGCRSESASSRAARETSLRGDKGDAFEVTRTASKRIPGRATRDELVELFDRLGIFAAAREQDGFLSAELQVPVDDADEIVVTATWTSPEAYDGWLANPVRAELGAQLEPLLDAEPEPRAYLVVRELRGT